MRTWEIRALGGPGSGHHGHKGRKGQRGGSLPRGFTREFFATPEGQKLFLRGTDPEIKNLIIDAYAEGNIPPAHIRSLGRITTNIPKDVGLSADGTLDLSQHSILLSGSTVYAYYDTAKHRMVISPLMAKELKEGVPRAKETLYHELAHVVVEERYGAAIGNRGMFLLRGPYFQLKNESKWPSITDLGLDEYALFDPKELFAESYSSWITKPETRTNIQRLYAENNFNFEGFMTEDKSWF